jgi:hypothetical protein
MEIDKSKFKDKMGRGLTQALFLEYNYDENLAVYTLDDQDKIYNGRVYPSLKRLYLACDDPIEYDFATTHLLGWNHWKKLLGNQFCLRHITEWREELELKLASESFKQILDQSEENYQASKWLAEKGWKKKGAGRPVKDKGDLELDKRIEEEFSADIIRMEKFT